MLKSFLIVSTSAFHYLDMLFTARREFYLTLFVWCSIWYLLSSTSRLTNHIFFCFFSNELFFTILFLQIPQSTPSGNEDKFLSLHASIWYVGKYFKYCVVEPSQRNKFKDKWVWVVYSSYLLGGEGLLLSSFKIIILLSSHFFFFAFSGFSLPLYLYFLKVEPIHEGTDERAPDFVFLAHIVDIMSSMHAPLLFRSFSSVPFSTRLFLLPMWPFAFVVVLTMWLKSKTFLFSFYNIRGRLNQTWIVPRAGFQVIWGVSPNYCLISGVFSDFWNSIEEHQGPAVLK